MVWSGQMAKLVGKNEIRADTEPDGGDVYLQRLAKRLTDLLSETVLTPQERADAGMVLGYLGDPRPGVGVKDGLPDIEWVKIEPGSFVMGADEETDPDAYGDEMPQFSCTLIKKPFCISRYPITVAQYQAFVDAGGYEQERFWTEVGRAWLRDENIDEPQQFGNKFQTLNHPQVGISWYEAMAFCAWLTEASGQEVRLPTEVEWERAARHTDGRIYPWGDEFESARCNMSDTGVGITSAVGIFPNGDAEGGAADMAGNILEWTTSLWGKDPFGAEFNYPYDPSDGRENLDAPDSVYRVLRGGAFFVNRNFVRCAVRFGDPPHGRYHYVGMRVVSPGLCGSGR